jgi:hypothetical protein
MHKVIYFKPRRFNWEITNKNYQNIVTRADGISKFNKLGSSAESGYKDIGLCDALPIV